MDDELPGLAYLKILCEQIEKLFKKEPNRGFNEIYQISKFKVLVSFADPQKGRILLRLAYNFVSNMDSNTAVTVMHLSPNDELNQMNIDE